jgi:hypothetical protein
MWFVTVKQRHGSYRALAVSFFTGAICSVGKISGRYAEEQNKLGSEPVPNAVDFSIRANSNRLRPLRGADFGGEGI